MMTCNVDKTRVVLADMLTENTGRHFLDSGGCNSRHWQKNQERDFELEPASVLSFRWKEISVTHNVYHFLTERLAYSEQLDEVFQDFCADHPDECWRECIALFLDHLRDKGLTVAGIYGEGEPVEVNTYNGEDLLSQTIQYTYAEVQGSYWSDLEEEDLEEEDLEEEDLEEPGDMLCLSGAYVFLQTHGGCDVRGGYTRPRVFESTTELGIFDNARGSIVCSNSDCDANWTTDDGTHWYRDGCCGVGAGTQLEEYEIVTLPESCEGRDAITDSDRIAARLGTDFDAESVADEAYALACREGMTGAVQTLQRRLQEGDLPHEEETRTRLLLAELTGDPSHLGVETDDEDVLCVTEGGDAFCPECGHKLEASLY